MRYNYEFNVLVNPDGDEIEDYVEEDSRYIEACELFNSQEYEKASDLFSDVLADANELFGDTDIRCVPVYKMYGTSLLRGVTQSLQEQVKDEEEAQALKLTEDNQNDLEISWDCLDAARVILEKSEKNDKNLNDLLSIYKLLSEHSEVNRNYDIAIEDISKAIDLYQKSNITNGEYEKCLRQRANCNKEIYSIKKHKEFYDKAMEDYSYIKKINIELMSKLAGELNIPKDEKSDYYNWDLFVKSHTGKDFSEKEDELLSYILFDKAVADEVNELNKEYENNSNKRSNLNPFGTPTLMFNDSFDKPQLPDTIKAISVKRVQPTEITKKVDKEKDDKKKEDENPTKKAKKE